MAELFATLGDPVPDRVVLMGMSCVGKTTLAARMDRVHHSFDSQYRYGSIGLPGLSSSRQWRRIARGCGEDRFVLDNWSTEDTLGEVLYSVLPEACILVLFDRYEDILARYRVPVRGDDRHRMMYDKMYLHTPFDRYRSARYFRADSGVYAERDFASFRREVG